MKRPVDTQHIITDKRRESSRIRIEKRKDLEIWFEKNKTKYTDEIYGDLIYENYNIAKQN